MREREPAPAADDYLFGPYCLDGGQGLLLRDGADVPLTPKLFETLRALAEAGGQIVSKDALVARVWPDTAVTDSSLTQNIWLLRRAIEHEGERYIDTVPRRGYRLRVPVQIRRAPPTIVPRQSGSSIPRPVSTLVARTREVRELVDLISEPATTLLTVTGPGGVGKTRVALDVARRVDATLDGAVWFVDLSTVRDAAFVPTAIARALGIEDDLYTPLLDAIVERLSARPALLALDNFEQLLDATPTLASMMTRTPGLTLLVTSRVLLRIPGERAYALEPLAIPSEAAVSADRVVESDAAMLFAQRVRAHRPSFAITETNAAAVAAICRRLDGLPLALELAAARMRVLTAEQLAAQLAAGAVPGPAPRGAAARHQTLNATLDWSHDLLEPRVRARFAQLAIFSGSFTLDAVSAVTQSDALDDIQTLVESSLVAVLDGPDSVRFRLLETIRQYAADRLSRGSRDALRRRHATYYLGLVENAAPALASPARASVLDRLSADHENFRAADATLAATDPVARLRLVVALGPFWHMRGHWQESLATTRAALDGCRDAAPALRAAALLHLGRLDFFMGDEDRAREAVEGGLALARSAGDLCLIARALDAVAQVYLKLGRDREGRDMAAEAVEKARESGDPVAQAEALTTLGTVRVAEDALTDARDLLTGALARASAIGDQLLVARARYYLTGVALLEGDRAAALRYGADAHAAETGDASWAHHLAEMHGRALIDAGRCDEAAPLIAASLDAMDTVGSRTCVPHGLEAAARLSFARGQVEDAAMLLGAADGLCRQFGVAMLPIERALYNKSLETVLAPSRRGALDASFGEGRRWPIEEALQRARAVCR